MKTDDKIDFIDHSADRIRGELFQTLEELDRRRLLAMDWRYQLAQHIALVVGVGIAGLAVGAAVFGLSRMKKRTKKARLTRDRVKAFTRAWDHPRQVATARIDRPLPAELARKVSLIFATALSTQLARRSAKRVMPASA